MLFVYPFDLYKFGLLLISANPSGIAELKLAEQLLDARRSAVQLSPLRPLRTLQDPLQLRRWRLGEGKGEARLHRVETEPQAL